MAKSDKKAAKNVGKKMFDDVTNSSADARNAVDEFYKSLLKGGKKAQPILDELSKLFSKTGDASKKASEKIKSSGKDLEAISLAALKGKKEFDSLQKTLATYDGPRFKAAGLITEELSNQLSLNEMINKSKESLQSLDEKSMTYAKLLSAEGKTQEDLAARSLTNQLKIEDTLKSIQDIETRLTELPQEIIDKETELNKLRQTGIDAAQKLQDITSKQDDLSQKLIDNETKRFDLVQQINSESDKSTRSKLEDELLSLMQEGENLNVQIIKSEQYKSRLLQKVNDISNEQISLQQDLNSIIDSRSRLTADSYALEDKLTDLYTEQSNIDFSTKINDSEKLKAIFNELDRLTESQISQQGDLSKKMKEVEESAFNVGTEQYRQVDLTDAITDRLSEQRSLESARTLILDTNNGLTEQQRNDALALIDSNIRVNQEQLKQTQALQAASEAYQSVNDKAKSLADTMSKPIDALFGIVPSGLSQMLGLDKIQSELKDKLFKSISDGFMGASGGVSGFFSAASMGASTLMASLAPILPLLLAIAGVVGLVKLFMKADAEVGQLAKNLNISYKEAIGVQGVAVDIATELNRSGVGAAEVTKQMVELQKATGINVGLLAKSNDQIKEVLATTTAMASQYGLAAEETMTLTAAASGAGNTVDSLVLAAEKFAEDGMVPAGEILKDIAKTSKGVLLSFKGDVVALARATKTAKMLGTTLDAMQSAGESLLNIESSIVAQNKARMLLGRNINLDAARYYALQGDTESLMQEMVKAAGSVEEYENMSVLQKKALAEAMGMQVSQLDEMMFKQKELNTLGIDQQKMNDLMNDSKNGTLDIQKELAKYSTDEQKALVKKIYDENRRSAIQEKLGKTITKVTDLLYKMVEPLLPIIDGFVDSLGNGEGVLAAMSKTFSVIGSVLGVIFEVSGAILKGAWMPIKITLNVISAIFEKIGQFVKYIKTDIFGIKDATGEAGKAAEETSMAMEVIKGIATAIGVIIGGWFLLKGLGKAKDALTSMYDSAKGIGSSLSEGFKNLKEGKIKEAFSKKKSPVEDIASKKIDTPEVDTKGADKTLKNTTSFADRLKSAFKSINDTLKAIFKGIGDMLKNIFTFIKDTVKTVLDFIKNVMKDIFKTIKDVAKELTTTLQSLMQNIGSLLNTAIDVIKDVGTNLIGAVGDLLGAVIEVIDTQGTALVNALGNVGNALAENVMKVVNTLLDGLGEAAGKLPGIMNSLGKAIGSFFSGLSGGLVTFAQAMATPTPFFGMPVGLILLGMAMGIAAALRIAAPGIAALGTLFEGLGKGIGAVAPAIEAAGTAISSILNGIGEVIESVGKAISTVITAIADSIVKFSDVDAGNIAAVGLSLGVLGAGLLALTAGEVVNGIASFFGASPVDTLKELETIDGNKMKTTADGLKSMSDALTNFGNVNTDPIVKSADALDKFNNQVIKGGLADGLNSFLGTDPFAVFNQLAAIDTAKIDSVATSIATAGTSIETFNQKMSALDDSVADKGDIISSLLNDIADIEYDEIDSLATAIDNLAKSYDTLMASMKSITDEDIARMQQITSATPKDVGGGGITDVIGDTLGSAMSGVKDLASSAISSVGSFFGFGEEEPKQEMQQPIATKPATVTPVMQPVATVATQPAAMQSETVVNNQNDNSKLEGLLRELITKVDQPVIVKLGNKTVAEMSDAISLRKSYGANINGYRS